MGAARRRELPIIEASWPTGEAFLEGVVQQEALASFWYAPPPGRGLPQGGRLGALVSVVLRFTDSGAELHVHARVIVRKPDGPGRGLRLELIREEAERQRLVLSCARGESVGYRRRRSARIPCSLPVQVTAGDGRLVEAEATTISRHGMHLALDSPPPLGAHVDVTVGFPGRGRRRLRLWGRVASVVPSGPQKGIGVEFVFSSAAERDALAEQVALLAARRAR
jgi:hypothetical protein